MSKREVVLSFTIGVITSVFAALLLWTTRTPLDYFGDARVIKGLLIGLPVLEVIGYFIARHLLGHVKVLGQMARFGMVGLMNFLVDTGILTALSIYTGVESGVNIIWLNVISTSIAISNSYVWNRNWTFRDREPMTFSGFATFVVVTIGGIAINSAIVFGVVSSIPISGVLTGTRRLAIAKLLATTVSLFWNFLGYKLVVFRKPTATLV